jgi:DNA-directed RNA polymerase specialized sigma24 family protein
MSRKVASALTFDANAGTSLQSRALDRALAHLPDEQRQVIPLVGLEGMRYEEAAKIRSIPIRHRPLAAVGIFSSACSMLMPPKFDL